MQGRLTPTTASTPAPNSTPKPQEVTTMVVAPDKPAPAEMDLSIPRNKWPRIIAMTSGHMLAYGWPGTGKSHDFMSYAMKRAAEKNAQNPDAETSYQYEEVNCTRQTSAAGWVGHYIDGPDGFIWKDGPVARAMRAGLPIVINDVHLCSDDLFDLLFFVLDTRPGAKMDTTGGVAITAAPGFRALLSMNGDPHQVLDEPILDRIGIKFEINMPSRWALEKLDPDVGPICKRLYKNAGPSGPKMTYRTFAEFCKNRRELGDPFWAARLAAGNEQNARALMEAIMVGVPPSTKGAGDED